MPRKRFANLPKPRNKQLEAIFPSRIGSWEYFGREIVLMAISIPIAMLLAGSDLFFYLFVFLVGLFAAWFMQIPRIRDIGWSPWLVLVTLTPGVGRVCDFILLFTPGKK
jgi:uncharacterized membrane protein YhaH (DUF805 family)